jgi:DNA polymerase-3 subunit delta'
MPQFRANAFLQTQLLRPVKNRRIVHAQIFAGPEGTGKMEAAKLVARALNCQGTGEKPCGACRSCLAFWDNASTMLSVIEPSGASIKIGQIRDMISDISLRPDHGVRCVVIDQAEKMTEAAQNALLKTLEEAPPYAAFFLLTSLPEALLPTIRSRCVTLRFPPQGDQAVKNELEKMGADADRAQLLSSLSFGSVGKALELNKDGEYLKICEDTLSAFRLLESKNDIPRVASALLPMRDKCALVLEMLEAAAGELMRGNVKTPLASVLKARGIDGARLMKAVIKASRMRNAHVAGHYVLETLLFDLFDIYDS